MAANSKMTGKANMRAMDNEHRTAGVNVVSLHAARAGKRREGSPGVKAVSPRTPTREQIAERAEAIWRQRGCVPGEDEQNWYEAEAQLRRELTASPLAH
ncbi:MAG: DUF2934 domain-containing protein [Sedimentisphaerales bacterium]|nr:DUF2934 domain-containing protein [Sedimentisphaerales bacterium]